MKLILTLGVLAVGCGSAPVAPQVVLGRVAQDTFSSPVDRVTVSRAGAIVAQVPVSADGSFSISIPPGQSYKLNLTTTADRATLISPRIAGTLDVTFAVRGSGAPFDLGMVRKIGDATQHSYNHGTTASGDGDGECEDGLDPSGAVCVDDADGGATCDGAQEDGTNDGETNDDGDAETNDDGDGETNDDGESPDANGDGLPDSAAVADHNLPPTMGCGDEGDGDNSGDPQD